MSTVQVASTTLSERRKRSRLKRIVVSEHNYVALKRLGHAGDSFNDVISRLLSVHSIYQRKREQREESDNLNNNSSDNVGFPFPSHLSGALTERNRLQLSHLLRYGNRKRTNNNQTDKQGDSSTKEEL